MRRFRAQLAAIASLALALGVLVSPVHTEPAFAATNNLTISTGTSSNVTLSAGVFTATANPAVLNVGELVTALGDGSIEVRASGSITVAADVISTTSDSLTLEAGVDIVVNNAVTISTNGGNIVLQSAAVASPTAGSIRLGSVNNTTGSLISNGGDITLSGGADAATGFALASGPITGGKPSAGVAVFGFTLNAGGGNILVRGSSSRTGSEATRGVLLDESGDGQPNFQTTGSGSIQILGEGSSSTTGQSSWGVNIRAASFSSGSGDIRIEGFVGNTSTSVNRRGISSEGAFNITSTSGDIVLLDRTNAAGHSATYFVLNSTMTTSGEVRIIGNKFENIVQPLIFDTPKATIEAFDAPSFTSALILGDVNATNAQRLDVGHVGNTANVTVSHPLSVGGVANIHGESISINKKFTATSRMSLFATTAVTQAEAIEAPQLSLHGAANFTLNDADNIVGVVAAGSQASPVGQLSLTDKQGGLLIGDVNSLSGVTATGAVSIATTSGDLEVNRPVESALATGDAVKLFANRSALVDDVGDGQILLSGTGTVIVEAGARGLLYSGEKSVSTGLVALVGAANVREQVESSTDLTTLASPIAATGLFALFRVASPDVIAGPTPSYTGPVLESFSTRSVDACQGTVVTITGTRLSGITSATVQGKRAAVIENTADRLVIRTPAGLTAGANQSLVITSAAGTLTHQNAFNVVGSSEVASCALDTTKGFWTQAQADGRTIKIYAKNPVGSGKVQFIVDGREIAWVRAIDATDPKLRVITTDGPMAGVSYLVRTISLNPGKNRIEIRVNGERVWRVTYLPRG